jgi:hypothetical protein
VDSAWEQNVKQLKASVSAYHPGARAGRFVGRFLLCKTHYLKTKTIAN